MADKAKLTEVPAGTPVFKIGFAGKALLLRPAITVGQKDKDTGERKGGGNLVWGVIRPGKDQLEYSGIVIPALAESLPTSVVVYNPETKDSFKAELTDGPTEHTDSKTGKTKTGIVSKVYRGAHLLPGTDVSRVLEVKITARKDGPWNVKIQATNAGGGAGSAPIVDMFVEGDDFLEV